MARPNDPVGQTESFETLRRKLLRQNRELARVNSTQSLKIRQLENECARMLSENLDLRGQILQLERELEDSKSQRIADHALEIKAKLETQLVEWGSLLAGLGLEPPAKRLDQRIRRASQSGSSLNRRSPPRKSLRDVAKDVEARAKEEGRLTPIMEHKSDSRRTMDRTEIMALCTEAEAADTSTSPDLGPPPMSRFVDEDPAPVESPSKAPPSPMDEPEAQEPPPPPPPPDTRKAPKKKETSATPALVPLKEMPAKASVAQDAPIKVLKSGSKRKFGVSDDIENSINVKGGDAAPSTKGAMKSAISRERTGAKTLKELANIRREAREKLSTSRANRKPLAAKSTNEDFSSPKKTSGRQTLVGDKVPGKQKAVKETPSEAVDPTQPTAPPAPPVLAPTAPAIVPPAAITVNIETHLMSPTSPVPSKPESEGRDTPPPADIGSNGETSRPSRRARSAISYAEPKLNVKMRRSTKEFVDAVAGEGKYQHRPSLRPEDMLLPSAETSTPKMKTLALSTEPIDAHDPPPSPLAEKSQASEHDDLGSKIVTDRRKRRSSVLTADSTKTLVEQDETPETSISSAATTDSSSFDVYDFPSNSPSDESKDTKNSDKSLRRSRSSRRSSALHEVDLGADLPERLKVPTSRKRERASMNVPKMTIPAVDAQVSESENESVSSRSRAVQRRKSTVL